MSTLKDHLNGGPFEAAQRIQTTDSIVIPKDVFEKLYLNPHQQPRADALRSTFANPTPVSLVGFLLAGTPNACAAMGWRGAGGGGAAIIPVFIFFGGMLLTFGAVGEWILGNTFSCVFFFTYAAFWLVQATGMMPFFASGSAYSPTGDFFAGRMTPEYNATVGFYYVCLTLLTFFFTICSIRTNICFFICLILLTAAFGCFAGVYFESALSHAATAARLQVTGGALLFALVALIWYLLLAQLLESVDFPVSLPVGDLSSIIPGRSQRNKKKTQSMDE